MSASVLLIKNITFVYGKISEWINYVQRNKILRQYLAILGLLVVKSSMLAIQHNTFFKIMNHLDPLTRKESSDSRADKNFTCNKTKKLLLSTAQETNSLKN